MFSLIISLILVVSLLLWNFITAKGQWFLKITTMLLISTVSILIHMSLRSYLGWPSDGFGFPEDFHLKAVHINEPMNGEEGGIYLWITKFSVEEKKDRIWFYKGKENEPRAFETEYTKEMHKKAQEWQKSINEGETIVGKRSDGKNNLNPEDSMGGWNSSWGQKYEMHKLPPPVVPEKSKQYWKNQK